MSCCGGVNSKSSVIMKLQNIRFMLRETNLKFLASLLYISSQTSRTGDTIEATLGISMGYGESLRIGGW